MTLSRPLPPSAAQPVDSHHAVIYTTWSYSRPVPLPDKSRILFHLEYSQAILFWSPVYHIVTLGSLRWGKKEQECVEGLWPSANRFISRVVLMGFKSEDNSWNPGFHKPEFQRQASCKKNSRLFSQQAFWAIRICFNGSEFEINSFSLHLSEIKAGEWKKMPKGRKPYFTFTHSAPKMHIQFAATMTGFCVVSQGLTEFCHYPETTLLHPVKWSPSISFLCSSLRPNKKAPFCVQQANDTLLNKTLPTRRISPALWTSKDQNLLSLSPWKHWQRDEGFWEIDTLKIPPTKSVCQQHWLMYLHPNRANHIFCTSHNSLLFFVLPCQRCIIQAWSAISGQGSSFLWSELLLCERSGHCQHLLAANWHHYLFSLWLHDNISKLLIKRTLA